eukprot:130768_1
MGICCSHRDNCCHRVFTVKSEYKAIPVMRSGDHNKDSSIDICADIWRWIKGEYTAEQLMCQLCSALKQIPTTKFPESSDNVIPTTFKHLLGTALGIAVGTLLSTLFGYFRNESYRECFPHEQLLIQDAMKLLMYKPSDIKSMQIGTQDQLKRKCKQKLMSHLISSQNFDVYHHSAYGDECESASDISTDSDTSEIDSQNEPHTYMDSRVTARMIIDKYQQCFVV